MTWRAAAVGCAAWLALSAVLVGLVLLGGCGGTAAKRAADAGSVTVAAAESARVQLVAWAVARAEALPAECRAECAPAADPAACVRACGERGLAPVERVRDAVRAYLGALEAARAGTAGDLPGAAAALVRAAQEVIR